MQFVQATFVVEEWVDHALDKAQKAEGKLDIAEKAHIEVDKKLKGTFAKLTKVENAQKNAEAAFNSFERQATTSLEAQRKAENKLALNMVELRQLQK